MKNYFLLSVDNEGVLKVMSYEKPVFTIDKDGKNRVKRYPVKNYFD
jgi:hypothetical protein